MPMKIITLSLFIIFGFSYGYSQTLFQSSFETKEKRDLWINVDYDGDGYTWGATDIAFDDEWAMASPSFIETTGEVLTPDDWFVSPVIDLSGINTGEKLTLSYYIGTWDPDKFRETYVVRVTEDIDVPDGDTLKYITDFHEKKTIYMETISEWKDDFYYLRTTDISFYAGKKIRIAFQHNGSSGQSELFLDNVFVQKTGSGADLFIDKVENPRSGAAYNLGYEMPAIINIVNVGLEKATGVKASFEILGTKVTEDIPEIASGASYQHTFSTNISAINEIKEPAEITFTLTCENDGNLTNNVSKIQFYVFPPHRVINWDFEDEDNTFKQFTLIKADDNTLHPQVKAYFKNDEAWTLLTVPDPNNFPTEYWGMGFVATTSSFSPNAPADRWLITPQVRLNASQFLLLWQSAVYATAPPGIISPDTYEVMVSETGKEPGDFVRLGYVERENGTLEGPNSYRANLSAYAGKEIYIAFHFISSHAMLVGPSIMCLDNIRIYSEKEDGAIVGMNEELIVNDILTAYPNPVVNTLNIESAAGMKEISIYNQIGLCVYNESLQDVNSTTLNLTSLAPDVYILKAETTSGEIITQKIIKK